MTSISEQFASLAEDLKDIVGAIEGSIPVTQNHYGRYLDLVQMFGRGDAERSKIVAVALVQAGANRNGVSDALNILTGRGL